MTARYYEEPPQDIIHLYDEEDGVWTLKPLESHECMTASCEEITAVRAYEHDQRAHTYMGIGDVNSDEKGSGARYNAGKPPMHFIPFRQQLLAYLPYFDADPRLGYLQDILWKLALFEQHDMSASEIVTGLEITDLHEAAYVWEYGAEKYAAFNWAKGMPWSVPMGCIGRHVQDILMGEEYDEESGRKHWGHIVCNLLMLEHYEQFYKEGDDRPSHKVFKSG